MLSSKRTLKKNLIGIRELRLSLLAIICLVAAGCASPSGVAAEEDENRLPKGEDLVEGEAMLPKGENYELVKVVDGFNQPIYVTHGDDGSGRLFIVEQVGAVWILDNGILLTQPFLDIGGKISFL